MKEYGFDFPVKGVAIKMIEKNREYATYELKNLCWRHNEPDLLKKLKELSDPDAVKFVSDGCSGPCPDKFKDVEIWDLCWWHDLAYWLGGSAYDRLVADQQLARGVASRVGVKIADTIYAGVRLGGKDTLLDKKYEWGFRKLALQ